MEQGTLFSKKYTVKIFSVAFSALFLPHTVLCRGTISAIQSGPVCYTLGRLEVVGYGEGIGVEAEYKLDKEQ